MNRTKIEWCRTYAADGSFDEGYSVNPVRFWPRGATTHTTTMCQKVSPGCAHCYAEGITRRFWPKDGAPFPGYTALGLVSGNFVLNEAALLSVMKHKNPARIFWGDMTDLFQESVPDEMLDRCFAVCALTPHLTHMFLTKRPERMLAYLSAPRGTTREAKRSASIRIASESIALKVFGYAEVAIYLPLPNVHLGVSVENQKAADERIPLLLQTPAAVRFISAEPLLGAVDLRYVNIRDYVVKGLMEWHTSRGDVVNPENYPKVMPVDALAGTDDHGDRFPGLDWVICGGESGHAARPMHPDWVRGLRDQCDAAGVPFFFKQWGEWQDGSDVRAKELTLYSDGRTCEFTKEAILAEERRSGIMHQVGSPRVISRVGNKAAGHLLDGVEWHQFPTEKKAAI